MEKEPTDATREAEPFTAFCVTSYPTKADQVQKTNGQMRYVLTRKETAGVSQRGYRTVEEVEVTLQNGGLRITTPEGHCGIKSEVGIIGLERALQEGLAKIRARSFPHQR